MRSETPRERHIGHANDGIFALGALCWFLLPFAAGGGYFWFVMQAFGFDGCGDDCRTDILYPAFAVLPWALIGSVALAPALSAALFVLRRRAAWGSIVALGLVVLSLILMQIAIQIGFAPMWERNDRIARGEVLPGDLPSPHAPESSVGTWGADAVGTAAAVRLDIFPDGTITGTDGCDDFTGTWERTPDGQTRLRKQYAATHSCPGVDTWLARTEVVEVREGYLVGENASGAAIGGLPRASN